MKKQKKTKQKKMIESYQKNPRERYKTISEEDKSKRQRITKKDVKVLLRKVKKKASILS